MIQVTCFQSQVPITGEDGSQLASCLIYAQAFIEYVCGCVLFQDVIVREICGR